MTVADLLNRVVSRNITEAEFKDEFFKFFNQGNLSDAEAQCMDDLLDDVNISEHVGSLFDASFLWMAQECLRLIGAKADPKEIRRFFAANPIP